MLPAPRDECSPPAAVSGDGVSESNHDSAADVSPFILLREDELRAVIAAVDEEEHLYISLACKLLRRVVRAHHSGRSLITPVSTALETASRVVFAERLGCPLDACVAAAAASGNTSALALLRDRHGCVLDEMTCVAAAAAGNVESLAWLHEQKVPWDDRTWHAAAAGGHVEALQFARAYRLHLLDVEGCDRAAGGGHLAALAWLRSIGCPWGVFTGIAAASGGHAQILRWLHAHGFMWWGVATFEAAARSGSLEAVRTLTDIGCPCGLSARRAAAECGHDEIVAWLDAGRHGGEAAAPPAVQQPLPLLGVHALE